MSREAFEAWISENDEHPRACMKNSDGRYAFPSVRNAYFIWQAARAAALEEAASAAFNHFVDVCREREVDQDFVRVWCSSDAIRALKERG